MKRGIFLWLILFLTISRAALGQQVIEGQIVDKETGKPVPFASIGIVGTAKGTSSNQNGQFSLTVEERFTIKVSCVGYESILISSIENARMIQLNPVATQLNEIFVFNKAVNPKRIVWRALSSIPRNYYTKSFVQNFFYRHYCMDDSVYGRLIEASVDVLKNNGYRASRKAFGEREELRVTQLRRSLDNTLAAQGHTPISIGNILQTDIVAYQVVEPDPHLKFYSEVSNLKADFENYTFTFDGITTFDGREVYKIKYAYKKDSILTTSGYIPAPESFGSLFINTKDYAFIKTEDVRKDGPNIIRSSAYYNKSGEKYFPYHLIREGENIFSNKQTHSFHIELMSVEIKHGDQEKFVGKEPGKEELMNIPYDSAYWKNATILRTTPLEDDIIRDLGGGTSLSHQFNLYKQYEWSTANGGENGEEKLTWLTSYLKGKKNIYLSFWRTDCDPCIKELERAKRLHTQYRNNIAFIFISTDGDDMRWKHYLTKHNLFSDGIINYRISENSSLLKFYKVRSLPKFVLISFDGQLFDVKSPSDQSLEVDLKNFIFSNP